MTDINKMEYGDGQSTSSGDDPSAIDLFTLYVLFSHFRPRDALMGICLLFFSLVMRTFAGAGTTFERNYFLE